MEDNLSYEGKMLKQFKMPSRRDVAHALLKTLVNHQGAIKEFATGEEVVDEIANIFELNEQQRTTYLKTIYRKENRIKKSLLWHRLLFRAADYLAKENMIVRPTITIQLTKKKEWMLTERGYDEGLRLLKIPIASKEYLPIKSYEVQKIKNYLEKAERVRNYNPVDINKKTKKTTRESLLRTRGFRQAIIQAYDYKCCVCGLKIASPDSFTWEVEAAHIVPHRFYGKDDIWNGIALCHFHHWSFDVGWFTLRDDFTIEVNDKIQNIPQEHGHIGDFDILRQSLKPNQPIILPEKSSIFPHENSISWHRNNIFTNKIG
jgi:hypothetical protein